MANKKSSSTEPKKAEEQQEISLSEIAPVVNPVIDSSKADLAASVEKRLANLEASALALTSLLAESNGHVTELEKGLTNLTAAVEKFAVHTGLGNLLREFNLKRWEPTKGDMRRGGK